MTPITAAHEHGSERVRITHYRLEDLIAEYKLLRQILFEVLEEGSLSANERNTLNASLDQAMMEACTGYALVLSSFRDQLFARVAHDLRTPLGAALASADLILRQPTAEHVPRWAARIIDNISRVDQMVHVLLDAMRVESGAGLQLELEECDLVEVVRQTLEHLQVDYGERFVKYGAPSGAISVAVHQTHERALLTVHNHGTHIPVEKQVTLFRAFQRITAAETSGKRGWAWALRRSVPSPRPTAGASWWIVCRSAARRLSSTFPLMRVPFRIQYCPARLSYRDREPLRLADAAGGSRIHISQRSAPASTARSSILRKLAVAR